MWRQIGSILAQLMACRLFGATLSTTWTNASIYRQLDPYKDLSEIQIKMQTFLFMTMHLEKTFAVHDTTTRERAAILEKEMS